jgi:hypothetical protein
VKRSFRVFLILSQERKLAWQPFCNPVEGSKRNTLTALFRKGFLKYKGKNKKKNKLGLSCAKLWSSLSKFCLF